MTIEENVDVLIFGGGIAGLWALNTLSSEGYDVTLVENDSLGKGQTIVTQGIIHGGDKYLLPNNFSLASYLGIKDMPKRWRTHFRGEKAPDLSDVKISSRECLYWFPNLDYKNRVMKMLMLFGRQFTNTWIKEYQKIDFPCTLEKAKIVLGVQEDVVHVPSLLEELAKKQKIIYAKEDPELIIKYHERFGEVVFGDYLFKPKAIIMAAGEGNEALAKKVGIEQKIMQRRPLRHLFLRGNLPELYCHIADGQTTMMTITSHDRIGRELVWNVGGDYSKLWLKESSETFIEKAKAKLVSYFPSLDLESCSAGFFDIDRAEGINNGQRPGDPIVYEHKNVLVVWSTKLTLAPKLSDIIQERIKKIVIFSSKKFFIPNNATKIAQAPWLQNQS